MAAMGEGRLHVSYPMGDPPMTTLTAPFPGLSIARAAPASPPAPRTRPAHGEKKEEGERRNWKKTRVETHRPGQRDCER